MSAIGMSIFPSHVYWRTDDSASDDEVMITRLLEKSIRRTEAVDREALCILAGEKVCH